MSTDEVADFLVVGGGSAGAVLAARLSEDPGRNVVLLEAGKAYASADFPPVLTDLAIVGGDPEHDWGYTARGGRLSPKIVALRGRTLGGSSAINGAVAVRARPIDFARWNVPGWSFGEVFPTFRRLENNPDGAEEFHGRSGPFPIRQRRREDLSPSGQAFIDACVHEGYPLIPDFNADVRGGVGPLPLNAIDEVRQNTALVYLTPEVRARPNLTVRGDVIVDRVLFEDGAASGVVAVDGTVLRAREVVLSAGAYGSAAILLRSGIGPGRDLRALGIEVVADLPVGQHLQDHPFFYNIYALAPGRTQMAPGPLAQLWAATSEAATGELDLHINAQHLLDPAISPTGGAIVFAISVVQPESRGSVRLSSRNPADPPIIDNNFLDTDRDRRRMLEGVRLARRIARNPVLAPFIAAEMMPGENVRDDALPDAVESSLASYGHPTATAPMGPAGDEQTVVDPFGAVHGVGGLTVADASIIPLVPSAAPNLTIVMLAERIGAQLRERSSTVRK
ncbi:MAG: choline dehydrogenase [Pseudonocardiales bacterium]|nr:choline dehydrogenase [Pseudonocardiales bacterium]